MIFNKEKAMEVNILMAKTNRFAQLSINHNIRIKVE